MRTRYFMPKARLYIDAMIRDASYRLIINVPGDERYDATLHVSCHAMPDDFSSLFSLFTRRRFLIRQEFAASDYSRRMFATISRRIIDHDAMPARRYAHQFTMFPDFAQFRYFLPFLSFSPCHARCCLLLPPAEPMPITPPPYGHHQNISSIA